MKDTFKIQEISIKGLGVHAMNDVEIDKIFSNVASELIKDSIKGAWEKTKIFFKDLDAKASMEYGRAYENYLKSTEIKYGKIKTLIYRRVPKELYSFYECTGVSYNGNTIDTSSINDLINVGNKIIITGTGGIGKSILFKHLFLNTIKETCLIPILIELRSLNSIDIKDISLYDVIYQSLVDNGFKLEEKYFKYSMEQGGYVVLLDGYDELNREKTVKVTKEIRELSSRYSENKYIVSSRPTPEFIGWNDFAEMTTLKLTKKQALSLITKIEFEENIKKKFYKELDENLYNKFKSFASNPLLLTIMLLTFENHASIPDRINDFYEQAFITLFNEHDATKGAFVRDIRTGLGCEEFKLIFSHLCFKSYFQDVFEFTESNLHKYIKDAKERANINRFKIEDFQDDLTGSVCMLVKEGLNYRFSHRSFQEYFAAWYTCKLTDDIQKNLLTKWMKESNSVIRDSYFTMLHNMQSEKVNKIILGPALKQLKNEYVKYGYTMELLSRLSDGVFVNIHYSGEIDDPNIDFSLSLRIKNKYLCYALILTCRLNEYSYELNNKEISAIAEKLNDIRKEEDIENGYLSFKKAVDHVGKDNLLMSLEWINKQILFGLSILEKYTTNTANRKKKVSSILDEL